ncbi:MAG: M28 family peptidase [Bacteroidales bacterium]|nr:M28 family peptidase [Bacteroidales bacterium]
MKRTVILFLCLTFGLGIFAQQSRTSSSTREELYLDAMHRYITSDKLFEYVVQFSDSVYKGRLVGTEAMALATAELEGYFSRLGLLPAGTKGYYQEYPNPSVEIGPNSGMGVLFPITGNRNSPTVWIEKTYPWADGWFAGNYSGNGQVIADVVYAGFGVSAPELGYDDYAGIDVKGKIVLIEGETPNRSRTPEDINKWYKHTLHQTKMETAAKRGAVGMLYKWVPGPNSLYNPDFLYCHVTDMVVDDIFLGTGRTYQETAAQIYETLKPASFPTGKRARINIESTYNPHSTGKNLLGMIRGSDPLLANEYIMVSAHLDHLGMIPWHIAGANDNLSCTAVMLGVAEALVKAEVKPKRSILFFSVDGEEAGLTGSHHFVDQPVVPKEQIKAIVNLEQLGAGERFSASYAYNFPGFASYVKESNDNYVHRRLSAGPTTYLPRPRTDGAVFMKAGYPCVDIRVAGGGFYHHPLDHPDSINPETLQAAANWLYWLVILLADEETLDLKKE